jgi:Fe-S cluster assembly protein SufD
MATTVLPIHENQEAYAADYALHEQDLPGPRDLRRAAIQRFGVLGFPTTKNEDWKFTNLAPFLKTPYELAPRVAAESVRERLAAAPFTDLGCPRLVFLNGRYAAELSSPPRGVRAGSLRENFERGAAGLDVDFEQNAMAALNTAMFEDGAYVEIADGSILDAPIQLLFVATSGAAYPRNLILAGRDSQASLIESYVGLGAQPTFTNTVTKLVAGDGAVVSHIKLQTETMGALHWGLLRIEQGASSSVTAHNIALGAALARNEIVAVLAGEGADCKLNGLYFATGHQHIDNHTTLDHARAHSTSHELYKGILDGASHGVFHGRIIVRPEAQKTDAIQRNKNLLLSRDAVINTKPQLEIYADDVRCTHGATVGQVDQDAVFYLRSRGIGLEEARSLLTYAFTSDIIEGIPVEAIRSPLAAAIAKRLAGEDV